MLNEDGVTITVGENPLATEQRESWQVTDTIFPATITVPDCNEPSWTGFTVNTAWLVPTEFIPAIGTIQLTVLSAVQPACASDELTPNVKLAPALTCDGTIFRVKLLAGMQAPPGSPGKLSIAGGLVTKLPTSTLPILTKAAPNAACVAGSQEYPRLIEPESQCEAR